jgi:hypothetical protein
MKNSIKTIFILLITLCHFTNALQAQKIEGLVFHTDTIAVDTTRHLENGDSTRLDTTPIPTQKWSGNFGLGLDAISLSLINPRPSEGAKLITLKGLLNFAVKYQGNRFLWQTSSEVRMIAVQTDTTNWAKAEDILLFNTQVGVRVRGNWYLSMMVDVQTQLLTTYDGKYIVKEPSSTLTSHFFAPATVKIVPGLLWKPKPYFSILMSVLSNKNIIVNNAALASQGNEEEGTSNLGNPWKSPSDFKSVDMQMGAECRMELNRPFANDKVLIKSVLDVYSSSLRDPNKMAIEWFSSLNIAVFKGLTFTMSSNWYYAPGILVKLGGDVNQLKRGVSIKNTTFFKYVHNF